MISIALIRDIHLGGSLVRILRVLGGSGNFASQGAILQWVFFLLLGSLWGAIASHCSFSLCEFFFVL